MKQLIVLLSAIVFLSACGPKKTETTTTESFNQLTEQQKTEGWKLLFDGQTLNGWKIFKAKENDTWEVKDGLLHCKAVSDSSSKRADLMTADMYQNFELAFDWKIPAGANSGVMFRVTEEFDVPYASGPEYQLIDDAGYPGGVKEVNQTASNYDVQAGENRKVSPIGEWNTAKIVVNGNHVEHWLNGTMVVEYEIGSDDWKTRVAGSKWKEYPGYAMSATGYIDLQDHGHEVWFRNVMIKVL